MQKLIHINIDPQSPNILFMPGVYNEAMNLLYEAQEYFTVFGDADQQHLDGNLRTLYTREMSRITLRLSCVMAWLLAQRSVVSQQISREQSAHYCLEFQNICRVDNSMLHGILPSYICYLLDSTYELYERVLRLDAQIVQIH